MQNLDILRPVLVLASLWVIAGLQVASSGAS
jgi:hypothetical protein